MGRDKAFLKIGGVPLWQRQLRILRQLEPDELLLAGPRRTEWMSACDAIVADACADAGPLAGLVASLRRCRTPSLLALAIDLPQMTADYLRRLIDACAVGTGVVPTRGDRLEPLAAVYPLASLGLAEEQLLTESYSLQEFGRRCLAQGLLLSRPIAPNEESLFLNLNTPADLAEAEQAPMSLGVD
jgi:molybdopterin-guanine dinucleotide biosynthesis protein A